MNCLQNLPRSSVFPVQSFKSCAKIPPCYVNILGVKKATDLHRSYSVKVTSGSAPSTNMEGAKVEEEKSEIYSSNMTEAMGAVLTYRHELGMNYNFIRPDLIVGSCLQTPEDVDKLRIIGVKTIYCLQQDSDLEYFGVEIAAIQEYANTFDDIQHLRAEIRDFDAFDLRLRLPAVVRKLHKAINRNGGVTYIHCTAGLGRAPTTVLAYMFWVQGYKLSEALNLLLSKRSCFPKLDAIKSATADMLTGLKKKPITLSWNGDNCSKVEISGLDIGWGQKIPLTYDEEEGLWVLHRELPEGRYEYKYIVDGEWLHNKDELVTPINKAGHINNYVQLTGLKKKPVTLSWNGDNCSTVEISGLDIGWGQKIPLTYDEEEGLWVLHRELSEGCYEYKYIVDGEWLHNKDELVSPINKDGHINNYVQVPDDNPDSIAAALRKRLTANDPYLTKNERLIIRQFLEACPDDE